MMPEKVFDYQDYKKYLHAVLRAEGTKRGFRARMAELMQVQRSFITRVLELNSSVDFSLEQAERLNSLLNHTPDEATFFLLLVQYTRAGTEGLRSHVRDQMKQILNRRLQLKQETESKNVLTPSDHMQYFSAWYYSAIRVAVAIPELQTIEALSERFFLPAAVISQILDFLAMRGLVERKGQRFVHSSQHTLSMGPEHPMVNRHHANWRMKALASLDRQAPRDLHYSYVVTLSENDALQIRSYLVEAIQDVIRRAGPSKEEAIYSLCLDFFEP